MPPTFESNYRMSNEELKRVLRPKLDSQGINKSQVAQFYHGRSVFVTGATGFVGRLLVEKLLRACSDGIDKVYILVRPKRGKSVEQRIKDLTSSLVFDGIRNTINLEEKLIAVEGDLTEKCYGLSQQQLDELSANVSVIFHSAASVNFNEPLVEATKTNLLGALNAIRLAKLLPKLESFVYVSTAYSNCIRLPEIHEQVYKPSVDPEVLIELVQAMDCEMAESLKEHLMEPFPNTYTFTKNLAEYLCSKNSHEVPMVICRPSVVVCTWREPIPSFVDNINGGNGINYGPASGLSVTMQASDSVVLDYVPVDIVVNCVVVLGWFCAQYHNRMNKPLKPETRKNLEDFRRNRTKILTSYATKDLLQIPLKQLEQLPVFHCTSGVENPITMSQFKNKMIKFANEYPTLQLYRRPRMTYLRSKLMFSINRYLQNTLVAKLMDYLSEIGLFKPEIYDQNDPIVKKKLAFRSERIDNFGQTIAYFLTHHWNFRPENRHLLIDKFMSNEDQRLFPCDMRQLDWDEYCRVYALGIRKYLLKEPLETLERAQLRMKQIKWRESILKYLVMFPIVYMLFRVFFQ